MRVVTYLIPLGIIGAVRWTAWLLRRIPAVLYKPFEADHREPLTVVSPVYQEDPAIFRAAIESWLANGVDEVICVIDATDTAAQQVAAEYPVKIIVTDVPGKRDALRKGWEAARTPLVALVDSDTLWADDVAARVCEPFSDPEVGGVGTRQNVYNPDTLWERFNDAYLDYRYFDEIAAQTKLGQAVSCVSGRTAVYRRELLLQISDDFMGETFLGLPCNSGEDKRLTMLTLRAGRKTYLQQNARVWSTFPKNGKTFLRQRLRWARNTWRSDLRTMFSGWAYKHKFLMFTMWDKALASFSLLLAPAFGIFAVATRNWTLLAVLVVWWLLSRSAKYLPHLLRRPSSLVLMPFIVLMSFVLSAVKIVALITVRRQRWLTRDVAVVNGRVARTTSGPVVGGAATMSGAAPGAFERLSGALPRAARPGRRFRLAGGAVVVMAVASAWMGAPAPAQRLGSTQCLLPDDPTPNRPQDNLLYNGANDKRTLTDFSPARVTRSNCNWRPDVRAMVLTTNKLTLQAGGQKVRTVAVPGPGPLNLETLVELVNDPAWLEMAAPAVVLLKAALYQREGTDLAVRAPGVSELRILDAPYAFLGGEAAKVRFDGVRVTSWAKDGQGPDRVHRDGRPFVLYENGSQMDIVRSKFDWLGSDRAGAYGVSWRENGATGSVTDSSFTNSFFGIYTYQARDIVFRNNILDDNVFYGIDPHDDSTGLVIEGNQASGNGSHGIIVSRNVTGAVIRGNKVTNNGGNGIVVDFNSTDNTVEGNSVDSNGIDGIVLLDSGRNTVVDNTVSNHKVGIRVNGDRADANRVSDNRISKSQSVGISVFAGAEQTVLRNNSITETGGVGIVLDGAGSQSQSDRVDVARTGLELRQPSTVNGTQAANVDVGLVVKRHNGRSSTVDSVNLAANQIGVRVDRESRVTVAKSQISADEPFKGSSIKQGRDTVINTGRKPGPRILGILALGFVAMAVLLEVVRRARLGSVHTPPGNAPEAVLNRA
ncbi:MAG: glycosyltransferase [Acidimicrobiales bacterium]